jgi:predicted nucleic acid-binding Zn ribbon protein
VREPQSASDALQRLLERLGLDKQLRTYRALMHWDAIVGAHLAQVARPLRIDAHTLWVAVKSHAWMQELTFHKRTILQRLNERVGEERFREVRFTVRAELPTAFQSGRRGDARRPPARTAPTERSGACRSGGEPAGR